VDVTNNRPTVIGPLRNEKKKLPDIDGDCVTEKDIPANNVTFDWLAKEDEASPSMFGNLRALPEVDKFAPDTTQGDPTSGNCPFKVPSMLKSSCSQGVPDNDV